MPAFSFGEKLFDVILVENMDMKSIKFPLVYLVCILIVTQFFFSSNSGGIYGKSTAGCGGAGCHQNSPNTLINLTGIPATGYVNGTTYPITLTVSNPTKSEAGFNLTVNQGTVTAGSGMSVNGTQELKHTQPKLMTSNVATWTFNWTAPATGTTPVIFFIAGNAVDGTNTAANDEFETTQAQFNAASTTSAPTITSVNANVTSSSTASITANINAHGDPASVSVEYGLTTSYGSSMAATPAVVTGSVATPVTASLTGLLPATIYHYRVVATNTIGTTQSSDGVFTTQPSSVSNVLPGSILVYPNPVQDFFIIEDAEQKTNLRFEIFDAMGRKTILPVLKLKEGNYKINSSGLASGQYIIRIQHNDKLFYHSLIKF